MLSRSLRFRAAFASLLVIASGGAATVGKADARWLPPLRVAASVRSDTIAVTRVLGLDPRRFQVLTRRSAAEVTLGYPGTRVTRRRGKRVTVRAAPCARITLRLSVVASPLEPAAFVATQVPRPTEAGEAIRGTGVDAVPRAWRLAGTIERSSFLVLDGVAAQQLRSGVLARFDLDARTVAINDVCGGTNSFTVGPGVEDLLSASVVTLVRSRRSGRAADFAG